jgi:hypothetical protein
MFLASSIGSYTIFYYVHEDGSLHGMYNIWVSVMLPSLGKPTMAGAFGGAPHVPHSGR